ncbi:MAG: MgtC/SapB family protein [Alphaproteobacteria bacterium]|nr:MgtC/SapB family protein [Alphaproteobacteria bacterium]
MWTEILDIVRVEFSDLKDLDEVVRMIVRLLVAAFLGGALGYERERNAKDAGIRTHMLVAVGTAIFVMVPLETGANVNDVTRVLQGIVQGIGFLGAGAIIVGTASQRTRGLTTAAGIWSTAGVGVAAGLGMESTAVLSTLLLLFILSVVPYVSKTIRKKHHELE